MVISDPDVSGEELQVLVQYQLIAALQEREHDLAEAQRVARLGSWTWDLATDVVSWSDELFRIFDVDPTGFVPSLEGFLGLVHGDDRARVEAVIGSALASHDEFRFEHRLRRGEVRWVRGTGVVEVAVDGTPTRMHGTAQEITEEMQARVALADEVRRGAARSLIAGEACIAIYDEHGVMEVATTGASALPLGLDDVRDPNGLGFIQADEVARVRRELIRLHTVPGETLHTAFRIRTGEEAGLVELHGVNATDDPTLRGTVISHTRVGRPHHPPLLSTTRDPLTGLANHALLFAYAQRAMNPALRYGWSSAVLVVDVDDFHVINETRGYEVGDEVLVEVAARISEALRAADVVGRETGSDPVADAVVSRLGGDRFVVVCENVRDGVAARVVAERISGLVSEPIPVTAGGDVRITVGIGAAIAGPSDRSLEQRIREAEDALRSAKASGRGSCEVIAEGASTERDVRRAAVRAMEHAFERNEFVLHYQPKVSLESDRVVGAEALLRWQDPARGLVPPLEFIPLAEETGLIVPIGAWVIEESCRQIADWHRGFPRRPPLVVAVNVSGCQFGPALVDTVAEALASTGAAPDQLCLEVTESTLITDADGAIRTLQQLAALGVKLSIDDFGTGYSSLSYLKRLPLHELKIDKSFVDGLGEDTDDTVIVGATVALAHALGLSVIAEGVETEEQLERLRVIGCQEAQGYFIARPMPADAFTQFLVTEATSGWRAATEAETATPTDAYRPYRVLVVDDTADVRQLARLALAASGFEVFDTPSGRDAVSMAEELRPDCVILDVSMPGMSGIEVCRALRDDPGNAGCTIVMLTSNSDAKQKIEAFSGGADDYIIKPFSPRDLVSRVRAAVRLRQTGGHDRPPLAPRTTDRSDA